jgi:hypothetical protein
MPDAAAASKPGMMRMSSPLLWAGIGTVAAVVLICVGVWIARGSGGSAEPSASLAASTISPANPAVPVPTRPGGNAIVNGNLDDRDPYGGAVGWSIRDKDKPNVSFITENGNRFVRLTNKDPNATIYVDQKVPVDPSWAAVSVSVRMRASDFQKGKGQSHDARVAMRFRDASDAPVGNWPPVPYLRESSGWIERTVKIDVPAGAKYLYVQLAVFYSTGTADFDDIRVIPQIAAPAR